MSVVISQEILQAANLTPEEPRQEIAIMLFSKNRLTLAQAAKLALMNRIAFQHLLASRQIPVHYDIEDAKHDLETLKSRRKP
ncbi:MAG: UPF0175 family protein [Bacteroidetes bacterium]|nr:UPF0175 family protein [Bacteroidota bacterium]